MIWWQTLIVVLMLMAGMAGFIFFLVRIVERISRRRCVDYLCEANRWQSCGDGRCRYHCGQLCQCIPQGTLGNLRIVRGGK